MDLGAAFLKIGRKSPERIGVLDLTKLAAAAVVRTRFLEARTGYFGDELGIAGYKPRSNVR